MALPEEQPPVDVQEVNDHARPTADVGQPAQRVHPGEHEIEGLSADGLRSDAEPGEVAEARQVEADDTAQERRSPAKPARA